MKSCYFDGCFSYILPHESQTTNTAIGLFMLKTDFNKFQRLSILNPPVCRQNKNHRKHAGRRISFLLCQRFPSSISKKEGNTRKGQFKLKLLQKHFIVQSFRVLPLYGSTLIYNVPENQSIWRFPKMGLPLNHLFLDRDFP